MQFLTPDRVVWAIRWANQLTSAVCADVQEKQRSSIISRKAHRWHVLGVCPCEPTLTYHGWIGPSSSSSSFFRVTVSNEIAARTTVTGSAAGNPAPNAAANLTKYYCALQTRSGPPRQTDLQTGSTKYAQAASPMHTLCRPACLVT